jgi:hypothetical protein
MLEHGRHARDLPQQSREQRAAAGRESAGGQGKLLAILREVIADESIPLRAPPSPHRL